MSKRIFIADPNEDNAKAYRKSLESSGHDVFEAYDGKSAIKSLNVNNSPDLIILNSFLPEVETLAVVKEIKREKRLTKIPIVILKDKFCDEKAFRAEGISNFIAKPCEISELLNMARAVFQRQDAQGAKVEKQSPLAKAGFFIFIGLIVIFLILVIVIPMLNSLRAGK